MMMRRHGKLSLLCLLGGCIELAPLALGRKRPDIIKWIAISLKLCINEQFCSIYTEFSFAFLCNFVQNV